MAEMKINIWIISYDMRKMLSQKGVNNDTNKIFTLLKIEWKIM